MKGFTTLTLATKKGKILVHSITYFEGFIYRKILLYIQMQSII